MKGTIKQFPERARLDLQLTGISTEHGSLFYNGHGLLTTKKKEVVGKKNEISRIEGDKGA